MKVPFSGKECAFSFVPFYGKECAFSFVPFNGKECAFSFVPFYGKECAFSLREMRYKALERTNEMHITKWLSKLASTSRTENRKKSLSQLEL